MSVKEEGVLSKTRGRGEETLIGAGTGRGCFFRGPFLGLRPFKRPNLNETGGAGDEDEIRLVSSREFVGRS